MALPVRELPTSSVTVGQDVIEFRSLTMKEADESRQYADDNLAMSSFVISAATGVTVEEADAWLGSVSFGDAQKLVLAILALSGLSGDEDPPTIYERAFLEGTLDSNRFYLARMLHRTVEELGQMSNAEYHQWRAFIAHEAAMRKLNAP